MLTVVWSPKGGQGCSTVSASLALLSSESSSLVDACGDGPAVLGMAEPSGDGVLDVLTSDLAVGVEVLSLLSSDAGATRVVPVGSADPSAVSPQRWCELAEVLRDDVGEWFVDAGTGPARVMAGVDGVRSVLVVRNCFLALRRSVGCRPDPDVVVLVEEPARALCRVDVEAVLTAAPVVSVPLDPSVARAVDAGLFASRLPRVLAGALEPALW